MIGFPPEPAALLEQVEKRRNDPDIAALVAVIHDQVRALKAAEVTINHMSTHLAAPTLADTSARRVRSENILFRRWMYERANGASRSRGRGKILPRDPQECDW